MFEISTDRSFLLCGVTMSVQSGPREIRTHQEISKNCSRRFAERTATDVPENHGVSLEQHESPRWGVVVEGEDSS